MQFHVFWMIITEVQHPARVGNDIHLTLNIMDLYSTDFRLNRLICYQTSELSTPEYPAVLKDPPTSTYEDVVNFLSYPSGIAILSPTV